MSPNRVGSTFMWDPSHMNGWCGTPPPPQTHGGIEGWTWHVNSWLCNSVTIILWNHPDSGMESFKLSHSVQETEEWTHYSVKHSPELMMLYLCIRNIHQLMDFIFFVSRCLEMMAMILAKEYSLEMFHKITLQLNINLFCWYCHNLYQWYRENV